jgi:HAD superfamily hydrolase (TIGR01549 family)
MISDELDGSAWLFDVDGTLVDSNYVHVAAWLEAFTSVGRSVEAWRIHRHIGMDSKQLLAELLGADADSLGPHVADAHQQAYAAKADLLTPLPGARDLLRHLANEGAALVLATSAPTEELDRLRRVLDIDELLTARTDASDVDTAKPDPGIVQIAIDRSGRGKERAIFVGDAIWDMQAASRAGIRPSASSVAVSAPGICTRPEPGTPTTTQPTC